MCMCGPVQNSQHRMLTITLLGRQQTMSVLAGVWSIMCTPGNTCSLNFVCTRWMHSSSLNIPLFWRDRYTSEPRGSRCHHFPLPAGVWYCPERSKCWEVLITPPSTGIYTYESASKQVYVQTSDKCISVPWQLSSVDCSSIRETGHTDFSGQPCM